MYLSKLITFILTILFMVACQPKGDVASSFGTKVPTDKTDSSSDNSSGNNSSSNLVSIVNGDKQSVAVGGTAVLPLVVLVLQAPGQPVANETVYFQVVGGSSHGSVDYSSVVTNSSGYAQVYFTAGSIIGDANIVASSPQGSVSFTITVTGATGYSLDFTPTNSGQGQTGNINSNLVQKFRVVLTDQYGSPVSGQNIRFVNTGAIQGNFSGASYVDSITNSTGIAESSLLTLSSTAGSHSITAYLLGDSSVSKLFNATSVTPFNSTIDPFKSKLFLSSGMIAADGMNTVEATIEIRDMYDNLIPNNTYSGLINISASPVMMYGSSWIGASWSYVATGIYKRTFLVGNTSGVIDFSATVNSVPFLSGSPSLQLTANSTVDNSKTTITSTVSPLSTDGVSTTTIVVQLRDTFSNPIDLSGQSIVVSTDLGTLIGSMTYHAATGTYRQLLRAPTSVGSGQLTITLQSINGVPISGVTHLLPLQAASINASNSTLSITDRIFTANSQSRTITLALRDSNNNGITAPATITMNKVIQSGALSGTFANAGVVTSLGNGVYQINLISPSNTTTCSGVSVICTEDISATVTVGATTVSLGPIRVQYKGVAMTPSAAHSYLVMNESSIPVGVGNVITGAIYLRTSTPDTYSVGGNQSSITVEFTGCSPTYSITDNNSGTYSISLFSPGSSCSGQMVVKYNSTQIGTTAAPGIASSIPFSFNFYGSLSLGQSVLTLSPSIVSGGGSTTASLEIKDESGNNFPSCIVPVSSIQFLENHSATQVAGGVSCTVVGGKAFYNQTIQRVSDFDEFYNVSIAAQYDSGSGWNSFSSMKTLQITPPNLAGFTIDCDNEAIYRDKYIYVNNGTLTINGWENGAIPSRNNCGPGTPIRFRKLRIGPTGIITHTKGTTANVYGVEFQATEEVHVEVGGKIDVTGRGYSGATVLNGSGYGPGNIAVSASNGSYGGVGSNEWTGRLTNNLANRQSTYGSSIDPNDLGSGGAGFSAAPLGTSGGGLIRIKTAYAKIDGSLIANGESTTTGYYVGSGGGIKIDLNSVGILDGVGTILAEGGVRTGQVMYGGGGRIAIIGDATGFTGQISSMAGHKNASVAFSSFGHHLGHGTVHITRAPLSMTSSLPWTYMSLGDGPNNSWLGGIGETDFTVPSSMTLTSIDKSIHFKKVTNNNTNLTTVNSSIIVDEEATFAGPLTVNAASTFNDLLSVSGAFIHAGNLTVDSLNVGGTAVITGNMIVSDSSTVNGLANISGFVDVTNDAIFNGGVTVGDNFKANYAKLSGISNLKTGQFQNLEIYTNLNLDGLLQADTLTSNASILFKPFAAIEGVDIDLQSGSITHQAISSTTEGQLRVDIQAQNSLSISSAVTIDVSGKGYSSTNIAGLSFTNYGYGPGFTTYARGNSDGWGGNPCRVRAEGGNHYTRGGGGGYATLNLYGATWGNILNPNSYGGGGPCGGVGGGIVRLISKNMTINTSIISNGTSRSAGGSIYLEAENLTINPGISLIARGGNNDPSTGGNAAYGGGAGGLITVKRKNLTGSINSNVSAGLDQSLVKVGEDGIFTEIVVP